MEQTNNRKVTAGRVAEEAGVSLATVDRVLNNRAGVRHETRQRVMEAARKLDFRRNVHAANLARQRSYRFLFLLPARASGFALGLEGAVSRTPDAFPDDDLHIAIEHVDMDRPSDLYAALENVDPTAWDGLAVKATDAPGIREVIDRLAAEDLPVVTLVTDAPGSKRHHYVGIDNVSAGRVAGSLMGRFLDRAPGKVGMIAGSLLMRDHVERRIGFEQVMASEYPHLTVLPVEESGDLPEATEAITRRLLRDSDDLVGIYSISAGNRGILNAVSGLPPDERPTLIVHELSPAVRRALIDGGVAAVINQSPEHEARSAVRILKALSDDQPLIESRERIRIDVYLRDNLP